MSKKHSEDRTEKNLETIDETLTSSEQFLEKNQKNILIALGIVVAIVGIFLVYHYLYKIPKNNKAQAAI
ncbi:MAG: hypothetical protein PHO94_08305, partial [Petrimonas sp.]|nr:hypothetical protein [Petrimonas sp.]